MVGAMTSIMFMQHALDCTTLALGAEQQCHRGGVLVALHELVRAREVA